VPVVFSGFRELNLAYKGAERDVRLRWRASLRKVAEPVRRDVERLALSSIRRMPGSPKWARMRVGVTQRVVYVAPRQRGTRGRGPRSRGANTGPPSFADLLADRALEPGLERNEEQMFRDVEQLMDRIAADFNG
jgi:hypothetical protein